MDPAYLEPSWFVESTHPAVREFASQAVGSARPERERALRLFYGVRDGIRYSAYGLRLDRESFRASSVLDEGRGWCVTKACLLAAVARAAGLPCRLGYANVRNHLATRKLLDLMGTDVFYYHGYNEFWLDGRWIKCTVAFNASLCEKARLKPLDWDGQTDSLYHPFDLEGRAHMEYLHDYGPFADVQYDAILRKFHEAYPVLRMFPGDAATPAGDFESEVAAETQAKLADQQ